MAKKAAAPQILSVPSSGGKGAFRMPWWGWVAVVGAAALVLAGLASGDWAVWIGLAFFGGWTAVAWVKEKGNMVDSFRDWMLVLFLLMTPLAVGINGCAGGVKTTIQSGKDSVGSNVKLPEWTVEQKPAATTVPPTPTSAVDAQGGTQ